MANTPAQTTPVFCTDEDVLIHAGSDYGLLANPWEQLAYAADGAFLSGDLWTLTSATIDFEAQGVGPNNVVLLTTPKSMYGSAGHYLAVESVSGTSATLRRPYKAPGVGQPPSPSGGLTSVTFNICTFASMIGEATYDLKQRFAIDDSVGQGIQRASSWIYDLQVLRVATVYWVLLERYTQEARSKGADFDTKVQRFRQKLADALDRVQVRWGPFGSSAQPATIFNCRLSR